jgi:2'-5' RNA ligase
VNNQLLRTFIALPVPEAVSNLQSMFKPTIADYTGKINWMHPSNIHFTLQFLGPTPESMIPDIKTALDAVAKSHQTFELDIAGSGCFPTSKRPRVLWVGTKGNTAPLIELGHSVRESMSQLGFPPDEKKFYPHITLGRITYPRTKTPNIKQYLSKRFDPIPWKPKYFSLMRSELFPNGSEYTILGTHIINN